METERHTLGDGDLFLKLCLPKLKGKDSPLHKRFAAYYGNMRGGFMNYAQKHLLKAAAKRQGAPYGAALNSFLCHENEHLISLYTDITVSDGEGNRYVRHGVLWHKETGNILNPKALFKKGAKKALTDALLVSAKEKSQSCGLPLYSDAHGRIRRHFGWERFYAGPAAAVFFFQGGMLSDDPKPFAISFSSKELFTKEALSMLWGLE